METLLQLPPAQPEVQLKELVRDTIRGIDGGIHRTLSFNFLNIVNLKSIGEFLLRRYLSDCAFKSWVWCDRALMLRSHQKRRDLSRRPKRVSLLATDPCSRQKHCKAPRGAGLISVACLRKDSYRFLHPTFPFHFVAFYLVIPCKITYKQMQIMNFTKEKSMSLREYILHTLFTWNALKQLYCESTQIVKSNKDEKPPDLCDVTSAERSDKESCAEVEARPSHRI